MNIQISWWVTKQELSRTAARQHWKAFTWTCVLALTKHSPALAELFLLNVKVGWPETASVLKGYFKTHFNYTLSTRDAKENEKTDNWFCMLSLTVCLNWETCLKLYFMAKATSQYKFIHYLSKIWRIEQLEKCQGRVKFQWTRQFRNLSVRTSLGSREAWI